jgi:hypothetical protein
MRKVGHNLDIALLREDYDYYKDELKESAAARSKEKRARNADHFVEHVATAFTVARIGYLFDAPLDALITVLQAALPELVTAVDLGANLSPISLREYFGAALLVGDQRLIKWLAQLPRDSYDESGIEVSEAAFLLIETVQAAMRADEKALRTKLAKFEAALTLKRLVINPKAEQATYQPLAQLLQALADKDQKAFGKAWTLQAKAWQKRFGRAAEKANMDGILDWEALGFGRLAQKLGLSVPDTNPYAPVPLLTAGKPL